MTNLLSVQEAQEYILSVFQAVETEEVGIWECDGRVLGAEVRANVDLPAFDNSSMDGFAVRAQDAQSAGPDSPITLAVIGDIPAGAAPTFRLQAGQAARIMTGASLPEGADAVVPVEDTDAPAGPQDNLPAAVTISSPVQAGQYVRWRGQDIRQGQMLLPRGRRLLPQDVGLLASTGQSRVMVYRRPRVALLSTGDELVEPGQALRAGQIYDSNQYVLAALLARAGAQVFALGIARDDPEQVHALLRQALAQRVDLIVTSAGVSVGAFDYVRHVIEQHGKLSFWRVNMRPGKPLAFGSFEGIPLIGLPGNPVSSFVGCRVFVIPVIHRLMGLTQPARSARYHAVLAQALESDGRESYLRAVVQEHNGRLTASLTGHQGSGNLFSLVQANALLIVPSGVKSLPIGSEVEIWFFDIL